MLLNLYVNDLVAELKATNVGVDIDGELVCVILYADNIVVNCRSCWTG